MIRLRHACGDQEFQVAVTLIDETFDGSLNLVIESNTPRLKWRFASLAMSPSTALSTEAEAVVKRKAQRTFAVGIPPRVRRRLN